MEVSGGLHDLPLGKSPWYPLDIRLCGLQSRSGRGGEEKESHNSPCGESKCGCVMTVYCLLTVLIVEKNIQHLTC